jgi:hypothetical protein
MFIANGGYWQKKRLEKYVFCGELATSLLTVKPVGVYSTTLVQYLYISCYVTVNKLVLSYLSLCLLPQW